MSNSSSVLSASAPGFRIRILDSNFSGDECLHYSGVGQIYSAKSIPCPNCSNFLFPAINLSFSDYRLEEILKWKMAELHVLYCAYCAFYMEPYWLKHESNLVLITGGFRDGGEMLQNINQPYNCREIDLTPLVEEDYPDNVEFKNLLLKRKRAPGVYHQIGGVPLKDINYIMACCSCSKQMPFCGVLDYDDLNVPLYEDNENPVALIIGDYDSMNMYACTDCSVIGLKWAR